MAVGMSCSVSNLASCDSRDQYSLVERVLSCTSTAVNEAMKENWLAVLDIIEERRQIFERARHQASSYCECLDALESALTESERAVNRVVAHAIVEARAANSAFAVFG